MNIPKTACPAILAAAVSCTTGCLSVTGYDSAARARTVESTLRVAVDSRPVREDSASLARDVALAARGNLSDRGFRVVDGGDADVRVSFDVSQYEFNRAGEYIVYDGRVDAKALAGRGSATRTLDEATLSARGERALGEAAAAAKLSAAIVPKVDEWVGRAVTTGKTGTGDSTVSVFYRNVRASRKAELVARFVSSASGVDGVRDVQVVSESWSPHWWRRDDCTVAYRLVYDAGSFPGGILNAIAAAHPELEMSVRPVGF